MYVVNLRKVGGSVMLALPPAILDLLRLQAGASVGVTVDNDRLVIDPHPRPRYRLEELLAASDYDTPRTQEEQDWIDLPAVGREIP